MFADSAYKKERSNALWNVIRSSIGFNGLR